MKRTLFIILFTFCVLLIAASLVGTFGRTAQPALATTATATPVQTASNLDIKYSKPTNNVGYGCGSLTINAPGQYRISYQVMVYSSRPQKDTGTVSAFAFLEGDHAVIDNLGNGLVMDQLGRDSQRVARVGGNSFRLMASLQGEAVISVGSPETYTLWVYESEGNNWDSLQCLGSRETTIIRAEPL